MRIGKSLSSPCIDNLCDLKWNGSWNNVHDNVAYWIVERVDAVTWGPNSFINVFRNLAQITHDFRKRGL